MIRIRVDDFPQTKGEPQHTLAAFREFHRCLSECIGGKRYLLGVIPGRCTVDDILFLRNETDCIIGMHGTDHDEARLDRNGGNQFESFYTSGQIRTELFDHRMALTEALGRPVEIYMPPRNVIDWRTFQAGIATGFEHFTTGPGTPADMRRDLREGWGIHSEPPDEYGRTDEMYQRNSHLVLRARATGLSSNVVLTLHWTWETNIGLQHMRKFFAEIPKELFEDFDG